MFGKGGPAFIHDAKQRKCVRIETSKYLPVAIRAVVAEPSRDSSSHFPQ